MKFIHTNEQQLPVPRDLSPQKLFDRAVADQDYSRKACLRTYHSRTVLVTGPDAGQEQSQPPGVLEDGNGEKRKGAGVKHWWNPFGRNNARKTKQSKDTPDSGAPPVSTPAYITGGISWAEPGLWSGKKAHFVLLHFEHRRQEANYLERVEVDIRVWQAGDAVKSMAKHSHKPLAKVPPPLAEDLADDAPPIILYAPRAVIGRPADVKVEPYWDGILRPGDTFRFAGDLHAPQERALRGAKETDPRSLLHIVAFGDADHKEPPPDFSVALVVLSDGKPFDLTAYEGTYHWGFAPLRHWLWSPYHPARFSKSAQLRPKGQKRILCDFASEDMRAKVRGLVQWCQPYDTVGFSVPVLPWLTLRYGSATRRAAWQGLSVTLEAVRDGSAWCAAIVIEIDTYCRR